MNDRKISAKQASVFKAWPCEWRKLRKWIAGYASAVVAALPNWADYYRVIEDISRYCGVTIDTLNKAGLALRQSLNAFKAAANNRTIGRYGAAKHKRLQQDQLMNLLDAPEFVRSVVLVWLDLECGSRMPRDRIHGSPLRFGFDDRE